ncbi:Hypothetical protein HEAR2502 [Herminiimonas arsenicoxydans]|uniref:Uncharacterized protein n=1 Tax=Herminiimonas arsenicoxydans TaxID=204773 RepID=A4G7Z2_HERAR|nr:Hypothetical protein HEAR2502 [Herminiimonas arsenicoxydans]
MYNNHDELNNPNFLTHVRRIPDAHLLHASEEQEKQDEADIETEDASEPAHITVVPFSTTKTGSFQ